LTLISTLSITVLAIINKVMIPKQDAAPNGHPMQQKHTQGSKAR